MSVHEYRFHSVWSVDAPPHAVFDALVDLASYPAWWPDVRSVSEVDEDTAEVVCRAVLPYRLALRLRRAVQDEPSGRLRVDLTGDLQGYIGCHVAADGDGTWLEIEQEVQVTKWLLRAAAPVARPLLVANHGAMMWRGQRGLRKHLAKATGTVRSLIPE